MSSVVANKIGLDIVDIEVEQKGVPDTDMFFQEPVLDASKDYVLGVSELSVPLGREPMLTLNKELQGRVFMEFRLRQLNGAMNAVAHANSVIADDRARLRLLHRQIQSPVDLLQTIIEFVHTFDDYLDNLPGNTIYSISVSASPSGILRFRGNAAFWKEYVIQLGQQDQTDTYARDIVGYNQEYIGVRKTGANTFTNKELTDKPAGITTFAADHQPNQWVAGQIVACKYSLYRYAEHRMRVEVDADLSIPANILVENGLQKIHYNVASFALEQNYQGRLTTTADSIVMDHVTHLTQNYAGNTIVKSKETPTTDWYKLNAAANVQNMRLHILVVRREYDVNSNSWLLVRNKLKMSDGLGNQDETSWFLTLKFVQTY